MDRQLKRVVLVDRFCDVPHTSSLTSGKVRRKHLWKIRFKRVINENIRARCTKHPKYDPEQDGHAGIKDKCSACTDIFFLYEASEKLDKFIREFTRRAAPWQLISRGASARARPRPAAVRDAES